MWLALIQSVEIIFLKTTQKTEVPEKDGFCLHAVLELNTVTSILSGIFILQDCLWILELTAPQLSEPIPENIYPVSISYRFCFSSVY